MRVRGPPPSQSSSAAARKAASKPIPRMRASKSTFSSVASPMPRFGRFTMRRSEISSAGFTTTLRYAVTSRISARSKKRVPPTMRYGTPARMNASSIARDWALVR